MKRSAIDKHVEPVRVTGGEGVRLEGDLAIPDNARGVVIFAHGSGSSRHSPRNQFVARALRDAGLGTLLFDLLTAEEDRVYETRFDIDLLSTRLAAATTWFNQQPRARGMKIGYFGASTGAAAALIAAARMGSGVGAVVSRGGRPDMAERELARVTAPTLLIVGGLDDVVIDLNRRAYAQLGCEKELVIVPGATHLFEEAGTLEEVARLAAEWFVRWLGRKM
jgi:dienelactone hydrolase